MVSMLKNMEHVICDVPYGAFYVFPSFEKYIGKKINNTSIKSGADLSMVLLNEENVVTVSGESFGSPQNIRFSYAVSEEEIITAMIKLNSILKKVYE